MFIDDFIAEAKRCPHKIAAYYMDEKITYGEIDIKSSQIASYLKQRNMGSGSVIGYHGQRNIDLLIAILGIWKAHAIYMPIDRILPYERKKIMCDQSRVQLILTDDESEDIKSIECISIGEIISKDIEYEEHKREISIDEISYIIFTSGTTGIPKGAMVTQAGMYNHLLAKKRFLNASSDMVLAQTANIGFDISIWQLVFPLMIGAAVHFVKDSEIMNFKKLTNYILNKKVQILELVPSYLEHWISFIQEKNITLPSLKYLFVTGEAFSPSLAKVCLAYFDNTQIVNAYGPAEAADDVTHYILDANINYNSIPLGRSIDGMRVDILDERGKIVPNGEKGLIYVTGVGVGKGYINDHEKTLHDFTMGLIVPGERSYNTGDTGYIGEDGLLYFCGRMNNQVKVHGHRIELEEIETRLQDIRNIAEAIVEVRNDPMSGLDRMIAYVRFDKEGVSLSKESIENELSKILPYYMIPKEYYICDAFPVSTNGKIDRKCVSEYVISNID